MSGAPSTPDLIARIGAALYGPRWQSELARLLGISDRAVRDVAAGRSALRADRLPRLRDAIAQRIDALGELYDEIEPLTIGPGTSKTPPPSTRPAAPVRRTRTGTRGRR